MVSAPGMSNLRPARATRSPRGMNRMAATSTSAATGAGTSSVHRQLISVSRPERTRPSENPLAPKTVYTLNARFRIGPSGNVVVSSDMLAGAVNAAATPFTKRAAISSPGSLARPPSKETRAKTASATRKTRRRPGTAGARPANKQQPAVAEHVAADDPLQGRGAQIERGPDGREGHADHRDVQGIQAQRAAEDEQDGPQLRCPGLAVPVTGIGEKCFG